MLTGSALVAEVQPSALPIFEELLEISRLDERVVEPVVQPQPVSELFAAQQPDAAALAQAQGVAVHWHDGGLWLLADAQLTGRVLRPLVANALEHAAGGRVLVTRSEERRVGIEGVSLCDTVLSPAS